jgi:hypothetical protein
MSTWLKRALLCASLAGGVLAIGATSASADEPAIGAELTGDVEVATDAGGEASANADVAIGLELTADLAGAGCGCDGVSSIEPRAAVGVDVELAVPDLAGSCSCPGEGGGDGDDGPAVAGNADVAGHRDDNDGGDGDLDVEAGIIRDRSDGPTGGSADQVLGADVSASDSDDTGDQPTDTTDEGTDAGTPSCLSLPTLGVLMTGNLTTVAGALFALAAHEELEFSVACAITDLVPDLVAAGDGSLALDLAGQTGAAIDRRSIVGIRGGADISLPIGASADASADVSADGALDARVTGDRGLCRPDIAIRGVDAAEIEVDLHAAGSSHHGSTEAGVGLDASGVLAIG